MGAPRTRSPRSLPSAPPPLSPPAAARPSPSPLSQRGNFSNATFAALFTNTYISFIKDISATYASAASAIGAPAPNITFFLGYGPMSTAYEGCVNATIAAVTAEGYRAYGLDYSIADYSPVGCEWHPSVPVHRQMALQALPVMSRVMGWDYTPPT